MAIMLKDAGDNVGYAWLCTIGINWANYSHASPASPLGMDLVQWSAGRMPAEMNLSLS